MIVESCVCPSTSLLSNNYRQEKYYMAMNKPSIKQNGHSNTNENRTDDDYGGGGNSEIPS
jgi:hypothetical protein